MTGPGRALVRAAGLALSAAVISVPSLAQEAHPGKPIYDRWCAGCHGVEGRGDGVAADRMLPRPRDFTRALYQIRTTASGGLPTDENILHVINVGMPGTAMPGWERKLSARDREALVDYLKTFSRFFETEGEPEPLEIGGAPSANEEALAEGREFYEAIECWKCHGQQGRGDGPSAPDLEDDDGFPIAAADLTEPWNFNGGGSVEAIYTRLRTGMDGTPMPSFSDLLESGYMTEEQLWHLAQYVHSLAPVEQPRVREVVRARLVEGELPATAADPAWDEVEPAFIPLVAQVILKPRWFAPRVDGVWVQALHNSREIAMRLAWHDPSRSPSPTWQPWQQRVLAVMGPDEGGIVEAQPLPDAFAVQFPLQVPTGRELPYFLMGDTRGPVYLWRWESQPEGAVEAMARGLAQYEPVADQRLTSDAEFQEGEWRLLLRRSLVTPDSTNQLQFTTGQPIPVAFFAWDGSNAESGPQGSVSSWYYLHLDQPQSNTVFVLPVAATLLTLALGYVMVTRAQRRGSTPPSEAPEP